MNRRLIILKLLQLMSVRGGGKGKDFEVYETFILMDGMVSKIYGL